MAKIAIFGDVHANLDALETVLDDCAAQGVEEYLCTGDVVGYNAEPHECMARIRTLGCPVVMGNHDCYVSSDQDLSDFNPNAAAVVEWTRRQLSEDELAWLRALPYSRPHKGVTLVHATMDRPENFGYVFDNYQAEANFTNQKTGVCFHGHTHCPMIYEKAPDGVFRIDPTELKDATFKIPFGRKYFINVGSVGQPRDGDPRASYVIYDTLAKEVRFRRLAYDVASAQAKVRRAGLPERLAERLQYGQ